MTDKVIYVSFVRLTDKMSQDWYLDYLARKGVTVEYWDIVALLRQEYHEPNAKTADYLRTVKSYGELESLLRLPENRAARYIMLVPYWGATVPLFRLLSKYNCRMYSLEWGAFPPLDKTKLRKNARRLPDMGKLVRRIYYRLKAEIYVRLGLVQPFEVVFAAGGVLLARSHHARTVVPVNLVDYDHYKQARMQGERLVAGRYAVFLDVYLPFHSDMEFEGGARVDADAYYAALNRFFRLLETEHGIKIVVAAHPKANYSTNPFNGREIFRACTPEVVRDADFVVAHHSTSLSYAVLNRKPLVFIYTNEMQERTRTIVSYLYGFAAYLDAPIYNVDGIADGSQAMIGAVNRERYDNYKYAFLTSSESENESTQEIFWRELKLNCVQEPPAEAVPAGTN